MSPFVAGADHSIVLIDENGFTADRMQNFCNKLCYTYARATRAVSMVPVAYVRFHSLNRADHSMRT